MDRIPPIVLATVLGIITGALTFLLVPMNAPIADHLNQALIVGAALTTIAWFMIARTREKDAKIRNKVRLMAVGLTVAFVLGTLMLGYLDFQNAFIANCTTRTSQRVCDCIRDAAAPQIYLAMVQQAPQVALGQTSYAAIERKAITQNRTTLVDAQQTCLR